jgi:adenosylcobinamide-GDP ribazoletransferase
MDRNDIPAPAFRPAFGDLRIALGLLTRLPLPHPPFKADDPRPAAHAAWAYPLVGIAVAACSAAGAGAALWLGLPAGVAALFAVLAGIFCTGALHEDGLADCADGFWGGWTRARRLEIMKDSQIGTYGAIALIAAIGLRWVAITGLISAGSFVAALIGAAVMSRAAMVLVMYGLPNARSAGLSSQTGRPPQAAALIAAGFGLTWAVLALPAPLFIALIVAGLVTLAAALIARAKIGGQTGDVLGATQQLVDLALILACLAALP